VRRLADGLGLVEHAGRGLGLHEGHHARPLAADEFADFLGVVGLAPSLGERTTSAPWRRAISPMRSAKKPLLSSANFWPGSAKLATAASMPALPVPEIARLNWFFVE
jgi:hypothetical protein